MLRLARAAFELTWRNTRRYGGYLVHVGIVLMFVGFTGAAFNQQRHALSGTRRKHAFRTIHHKTADRHRCR